jgi:chitinase
MTNIINIIYYYQTLIGLQNILNNPDKIYPTHIILSSFHFGKDENNLPYIHLNDYKPTDKRYDDLWGELRNATNLGIKIMIMLGGAGGAYQEMFSNYKFYYGLIKNFLKNNNFIVGIDLDVEEYVDVSDIRNLIKDIDNDFGKDFIITMAPVDAALTNNFPGLGGFVYSDLIKTNEGKRINWFNGQFYYNYTEDEYSEAMKNGFTPDKVVLGMVYYQFNSITFNLALKEIKKIKNKYNNFCGVFVWEYIHAPSLDDKPENWCVDIHNYLI